MKKWEKPILSVLGINKTKGGKTFKILSGVPLFDSDNLYTRSSVEGTSSDSSSNNGPSVNTGDSNGDRNGDSNNGDS